MKAPKRRTLDRESWLPRRLLGRRAFTVIELLVIMGIISILISAVTVVIGSATRTARITSTKARLVKIGDLIRQRRDAFGRLEIREGEIRTVQKQLVANGVPVNVARGVAPIFAFKNRYRAAFPQIPADNPSLYAPGEDTNTNGVLDAGEDTNGNGRLETNPLARNIVSIADSSELLYFTLTNADQFGMQSLGGEFEAEELADTDGDGLLELVDAWGQPFRFYRWPTRLIRTTGFTYTGPPAAPPAVDGLEAARILIGGVDQKLLGRDPDDPLGYFNRIQYQNAGGASYDIRLYGLVHSTFAAPIPGFTEADYHTPETFHTPLVVSAGPDGVLGLLEPNDATPINRLCVIDSAVVFGSPSNSPLNDNLTNRNLQVGGN